MRNTTFVLVLVVLCLLAACGAAFAGNAYGKLKHNADTSGTDPIASTWTADVSWDPTSGVATVEFTVPNLSELLATPGVFTATWSNIVVDADQGVVIDSLVMGLDGDPAVNLNFAASGGNSGATFDILSAALTFPTLANSIAAASAAITVTDYALTRDGATANGLLSGHFYEARYNTTSVYGNLVASPVGVIPGGGSSSVPENGPVLSVGSVSGMQSEFKFNVTAKDQVSGTSSYALQGDPVPEPSSVLALITGVIGLAGIIRRRK